jgi:hypothetical protein
MTAAMDAFAMQNAMMLGDQAGAVLASAPSTVLSPMNYTVDNVRPFNVQVYATSIHGPMNPTLILMIEPLPLTSLV